MKNVSRLMAIAAVPEEVSGADNRSILKLSGNHMDASTQALAEKTAKLQVLSAEDDQDTGGIYAANMQRVLDVTQGYFNLATQYTGSVGSDPGSRMEQHAKLAETPAERKFEPEIGRVALLRAARGYSSPPCYAREIAPDYFGGNQDSK
jgi:hypothetical protein